MTQLWEAHPPFQNSRGVPPRNLDQQLPPSFQPIASATRLGIITTRVLPTGRSFIAGGIIQGYLQAACWALDVDRLRLSYLYST